MPDDIATRLARVRDDIEGAAARSGRTGGAITLVAVSKTVPIERVTDAYAAGQRVFGENRVQEGVAKIEASRASMPDAEWHLVGHLQTNKAKSALQLFTLLQSVDSRRLAGVLNTHALRLGIRLPVLLEVNVAGESSKSGFSVDAVKTELPALLTLPQLEIRGLMTVAPLVSNAEDVRCVFRALRELRDEVQDRFPQVRALSMGMSDDFRVAIEEGATMVRIGRALFGERPAGTR